MNWAASIQKNIIDSEKLLKVEQLSREYPYWTAPFLLLAKDSGQSMESTVYLKVVQNAAIRIGERKALYSLLIRPLAKKIAEDVVLEISPVIDQKLSKSADESEIQKLKDELEKNIVSQAVQSSLNYETELAEKEITPSSQVNEEPIKSRSFSSWMSFLENKTERVETAIIDSFIAESKERVDTGSKFFNPVEDTKASLIDDESFVTETLGRVYADQGLFEKAIQVYELLSLKYPQKSSYFAALIKELKDNTIN